MGSMTTTVILNDRGVKHDFGVFVGKYDKMLLPGNDKGRSRMTLASRIEAARKVQKISQGDLARRLGITRPTVSMWESGQNVPRLPTIAELAKVLCVGQEWLVTGVGRGPGMDVTAPLKQNKDQVLSQKVSDQKNLGFSIDDAAPVRFSHDLDMPVYAGAEGGSGELLIHGEPVDYISRPTSLEHVKDAFAVVVTGTSMVPAFKPGELAMVNPRQAPAPGDDCILVSTNEVTGERRGMIKEFVRSTATVWVVRQYEPAETLELPRAEWQTAYKVVGKLNR